MSHPIHLHLVHFQVLGRQSAADYDPAEDDIDLDALDAPESYELGWNDVVTVDPGNVVHVIAHFGEFKDCSPIGRSRDCSPIRQRLYVALSHDRTRGPRHDATVQGSIAR